MNRPIIVSLIIIGIIITVGLTANYQINSDGTKHQIKITTNKDQYSSNETVEIKVKNTGNMALRFPDPTGNLRITHGENDELIWGPRTEGANVIFDRGQESITKFDMLDYPTELESGIYDIRVRYQIEGDDEFYYSFNQFEITE